MYDVCGQPILAQTLTFTTSDTVSALYTFSGKYGCRSDTLTFNHNGAHDVNSWNWVFNGGTPITIQSPTVIWSASSSNTIQCIVSNGVCLDTANSVVELNNEVKAAFSMPAIICPEDPLEVKNLSSGTIDLWHWRFDRVATSDLENPAPQLFPTILREAYYTVHL